MTLYRLTEPEGDLPGSAAVVSWEDLQLGDLVSAWEGDFAADVFVGCYVIRSEVATGDRGGFAVLADEVAEPDWHRLDRTPALLQLAPLPYWNHWGPPVPAIYPLPQKGYTFSTGDFVGYSDPTTGGDTANDVPVWTGNLVISNDTH